MHYVIIGLYIIALLFTFLFSLAQLHLTVHYLRRLRRKGKQGISTLPPAEDLPQVTVQLPIYNELYVVERLIDCVAELDYPKDKLEIQVLDDSTDETVALTAKKVAEWQAKGIDIQHVRRPERKGFKAGALQYGMGIAKGEFLAIFDADFLPKKDWLLQTVPNFSRPEVGVVQTRWGHINKDYSLLTRLQAFALDAHFTIEQGGRNEAHSFINFNGTAGIWRKKCIIDAGGWSADTLTEDLDLSYRAQMKGWQFEYLEHVEAPAELPVFMPAIKSQQYRWNKGGAQTARKNLSKVMGHSLKLGNKFHAIFHLLNSTVFLAILTAGILSIPMLFIKVAYPEFNLLFNLGSIFLIGFASIMIFYWVASRRLYPNQTRTYFWSNFPLFLTMSMGLSLHNAIAVAEGLMGKQSPFIRTPKFNVENKKEGISGNIYVKPTITWLTVFEGILSLYFLFGIAAGIWLGDYGLLLFHVMLAFGYGLIFYHSVKPLKYV
ncbi:MAG TPA: histidine kinase [Cytophagales bacterium]|nr:histidine kinase [Cytophagales bacterium]HAA19730.1 histidine kinase [Cytophagales bacterium]HAP61608.1 histidine kinase [Cytophagales bacterium]